jgi:hypothetical protein
LRHEARVVSADIPRFSAEQQSAFPLDPSRKTIFLLITCGQAVRNFLLSGVMSSLRARHNVVILSPYAYAEEFRSTYCAPGVHVLPWFESFRSVSERFFQYYLMSKSGSGTHERWLANLEKRAETDNTPPYRFRKHQAVRRISGVLGALLGQRRMQALYHSYFLSYLPRPMFAQLFASYRPALVISTTAHHVEAWPLTYFAREQGCATLANILSWDNLTTKAAIDASCDYYTVWSEEMKEQLAKHYPYVHTKTFVTGSPLFDMYYAKRGEIDRDTFLSGFGLAPELPYVLWTTNTPAGMPDEHKIIHQYWEAIGRSPLAGKISLLVRLHPKETQEQYLPLLKLNNVVLTLAGRPHWLKSDRWLPNEDDMQLLLNSMRHAAVSVNVASTMSLESFALDLPTINVAFKSSSDLDDHMLMWSFDMYHTSDHYRAIMDNGAVDFARSVDELVSLTVRALEQPDRHKAAMQKTLAQKAAYCDGSAALRFVQVVEYALEDGEKARRPHERLGRGEVAQPFAPRSVLAGGSRVDVAKLTAQSMDRPSSRTGMAGQQV